MKIEVFDNLLDEKETNHIENFLRDPKFPWFLSIGYNHYTVDQTTYEKNFLEERGETVLLTHVFYLNTFRQSDNYLLSDFVFDRFLQRTQISFEKLLRSKSNLQICSKTDKIHTTPHIDSTEPHKVLMYYANDSDGDTVFFDNNFNKIEAVTPKKGRFVLFDGSIHHAAGFNKISDLRINLNFNFV